MHRFLKSFHYAITGVLHGFRFERNLQFHQLAAIVVCIAGAVTGLSTFEWIVILLLIGGMMALELINTAIERTVDLVTKDIHPLAKQAKDVAAGAVLLFAITSAIIGLIIFIPKWFG